MQQNMLCYSSSALCADAWCCKSTSYALCLCVSMRCVVAQSVQMLQGLKQSMCDSISNQESAQVCMCDSQTAQQCARVACRLQSPFSVTSCIAQIRLQGLQASAWLLQMITPTQSSRHVQVDDDCWLSVGMSAGRLQSWHVRSKIGAAALPHAHVKLLVEVTVKDSAIPANIDCVSAHNTVCCRNIESFHQHLQTQLIQDVKYLYRCQIVTVSCQCAKCSYDEPQSSRTRP